MGGKLCGEESFALSRIAVIPGVVQVLQCLFDLGWHAGVAFAGPEVKSFRRRYPPGHLVRVDRRYAEQLPVSQA